MNIFLDNVDLMSTSGPNHFGNKLKNSLESLGCTFGFEKPVDVQLSFISVRNRIPSVPLFLRLDGIYFNSKFDFNQQNSPILDSYRKADGVIFQTQFNKDLIFNYFGKHHNYSIIRNGANLEFIQNIRPFNHQIISRARKIWSCASSWRPHKRLDENIRYFLEHSGPSDCLLVAGDVPRENHLKNHRIFYLGNLPIEELMSIYKVSDYFIHLAWLDHCPNVVVDALSCGCKIVCSSSGGTKEIAGEGATVILEEEWDFSPVDLYNPPKLDFNKTSTNKLTYINDIKKVGKQYKSFLERSL